MDLILDKSAPARMQFAHRNGGQFRVLPGQRFEHHELTPAMARAGVRIYNPALDAPIVKELAVEEAAERVVELSAAAAESERIIAGLRATLAASKAERDGLADRLNKAESANKGHVIRIGDLERVVQNLQAALKGGGVRPWAGLDDEALVAFVNAVKPDGPVSGRGMNTRAWAWIGVQGDLAVAEMWATYQAGVS